MKRAISGILGIIFILFTSAPVMAIDRDITSQINNILSKGPANDNYHIDAWQLRDWIKEGRTDFQVLDVRMPPERGQWGTPKYGRIPGSIYIPYTEVFKPENLARIPKDKKIILVGHMGVYENYLVVPLRLAGYDAYILLMGMSGWQKDYPAVNHVKSLIHAPQKEDFPLHQEAKGHMMRHKHGKHH